MVGMGWDRRVGRVLKDHTNTEWLGWGGLGVLEGPLKITEAQNGWGGLGWVYWKGPYRSQKHRMVGMG